MKRHEYLGKTFACACGKTHHIPVLRVEIGAGILKQLPALLQELYCDGKGIVICDRTTWTVAGQAIIDFKIPGLDTYVIASSRPHADTTTAMQVRDTVKEADYLIACGSGTVTDLTKYAAHDIGVPLIAVATAPSMNGYTSGIVALTDQGLKTTAPATPALALIADLDILTNAPLPMIQAGLGDLVSKPVCNADWKLASMIRGETFCALPSQLIADLEAIYLPKAERIPTRDPLVIRALIEAIAYSGISMVLAGSSSPASGGEHLISHSLDMREGLGGREPLDYHGTQVGIATLVTAKLYQHFLSLSPSDIDWKAAERRWEPLDTHAQRLHATWGDAADGVVAAFKNKHPATQAAHLKELCRIKDQWAELQEAVAPLIANTPAINTALAAAGAKTSHRELGLRDTDFHRIVLGARYIRDRYSILDLLEILNMLEPALDMT